MGDADDSVEVLLVSSKSVEPWSTRVFHPQTGAELWGLKGSELRGHSAAMAVPLGDDHLMIPVDSQSLITTIGLQSKERPCVRSVLPGIASNLVVTADGSMIFASIGEKIAVWLTGSGQLVAMVSAHYQVVSKLALSDDSACLISGAKDGSISVWNVASLATDSDVGQTFARVTPIHRWLRHSLAVNDIIVTPGGLNSHVISASGDQTVKIHSVATGQLLFTAIFDSVPTAVATDPAECHLFVGSDKGLIARLNLFQLKDREKDRHVFQHSTDPQVANYAGHKAKVLCLQVNFDCCLLASGSEDTTARLWDVASRQCLRTFQFKGPITTVTFMPMPPALKSDRFRSRVALKPLQKQIVGDLNHLDVTTDLQRIPDGKAVGNAQMNDESELRRAMRINQELFNFALENLNSASDAN